ncbi:hypothetical protein V2G26_010245 [Clonostachys chloroleuca]
MAEPYSVPTALVDFLNTMPASRVLAKARVEPETGPLHPVTFHQSASPLCFVAPFWILSIRGAGPFLFGTQATDQGWFRLLPAANQLPGGHEVTGVCWTDTFM